MKKLSILLLAMLGIVFLAACNDDDTYADQLEKEDRAIKEYISKEKITVISEEQFKNQNNTTDVAKNQYVKLDNSGVYMQIVEEGTGEKLQNGETATVLARFDETNLLTNTLWLSNRTLSESGNVDKFSVTKTNASFTGSFDASSSVMYQTYRSAAVPEGWLAMMPYVKLGRRTSADAKEAHVKLIVPSQQGTLEATRSVVPMAYDITLLRGI